MANPKIEKDAENPDKVGQEHGAAGGEPMTHEQADYLKELCAEAEEEFEPGLSRRQAEVRIKELQEATGRGITGRGQDMRS